MVGWLHSFRKASAVWPSTRTNDEINRPHGRPIRRAQGRSKKIESIQSMPLFICINGSGAPALDFRISNGALRRTLLLLPSNNKPPSP